MGTNLIDSALVVGAGGQLGSRLVQDLEANGTRVFVSSRTKLNHPRCLPYQSLLDLHDFPDVELIVSAAGPRAGHALSNPREVLEWARLHGHLLKSLGQRFEHATCVSLSTTNVYSSEPVGLISEKSPLVNEHPYAQAHALIENALLGSGNWSVLRLSNIVGPPGPLGEVDKNLVSNSLVLGAIEKGVLLLRSNPLARRDFLPATNLYRAINFLQLNQISGAYNLSSGKTTTLAALGRLIAEEWETRTGDKIDLMLETASTETPYFSFSSEKITSLGLDLDLDIRHELAALLNSLLVGAK